MEKLLTSSATRTLHKDHFDLPDHKPLTNYLSVKTIICFSEAFRYEPHQNIPGCNRVATRAMRPNKINQSNAHTHNCSVQIQLANSAKLKYIICGGEYDFNSIGVYLKLETSTVRMTQSKILQF